MGCKRRGLFTVALRGGCQVLSVHMEQLINIFLYFSTVFQETSALSYCKASWFLGPGMLRAIPWSAYVEMIPPIALDTLEIFVLLCHPITIASLY